MPIDITTKVSPVIEKAKELCQLIVDQPHFEKLLADIETFMGDSDAQALHDALSSKQQVLVNKQNGSESLSKQEIDDFERTRDTLIANPMTKSFRGQGFPDATLRDHPQPEGPLSTSQETKRGPSPSEGHPSAPYP